MQVLVDGEIGKNPAAFRNVADAERGDAERRPAGRLGAEDRYAAVARRGQSHEAAQRRGLAGAVAAQQCGHLALAGLEADTMQNVALAVKSVEPFGGQGGGHAA